MTAAGIRTVGPRDVIFRSRLEARWAAFFTLLSWQWEYEPELELNKWIPDFAIVAGGGLLVEVKPAIVIGELDRHKPRIDQSGTAWPVWLVGASPTICQWYEPTVGHGTHWGPVATHDVARMTLLEATHAGPRDVQRLWVRAGNALQWKRL